MQRFYKSLCELKNLQVNEAELVTLGQGIYLKCMANSRGQVECAGQAEYMQNILKFKMKMDMTYIDEFYKSLGPVLDQYKLKKDFSDESCMS